MTYKTPVLERDEYTVFIQDLNGVLFMHCDVRRWSASLAKQGRREWDALFAHLDQTVFALNEPAGCTKHQKFLRLMGFEFFKSLTAIDGSEQLIFRRGK